MPVVRSEGFLGEGQEQCRVLRFTAEGEMGHKAGSSQCFHPERGKALGTLEAAGDGQFQYQVHASQQGQTGPLPFVPQRQLPPLGQATAHDGYDGCRAQLFPGFGQLAGMAPVEGIVFGHQADDSRKFHGLTPNFYFTNP